jgi:hypothetical protein
MNSLLLKLGRSMGETNWEQLRQFVKAAKAVEAGTAKKAVANLQFSTVERDAFQRAGMEMLPDASSVGSNLLELNRQTLPEFYKPDVITKVKMMIKRGADNSRTFSINQVVEDSEGVLSKAKGNVLAKDKNLSAKFSGNTKNMAVKGGYDFDMERLVAGDGGGFGVKTSCVSKGDKYNANLDVGNIINNANVNIKAPKDYLDGIIKAMGGESFEEYWTTAIPEMFAKIKNLF